MYNADDDSPWESCNQLHRGLAMEIILLLFYFIVMATSSVFLFGTLLIVFACAKVDKPTRKEYINLYIVMGLNIFIILYCGIHSASIYFSL